MDVDHALATLLALGWIQSAKKCASAAPMLRSPCLDSGCIRLREVGAHRWGGGPQSWLAATPSQAFRVTKRSTCAVCALPMQHYKHGERALRASTALQILSEGHCATTPSRTFTCSVASGPSGCGRSLPSRPPSAHAHHFRRGVRPSICCPPPRPKRTGACRDLLTSKPRVLARRCGDVTIGAVVLTPATQDHT